MATTFPARFTGPTVAELGEKAVIREIVTQAPSEFNGDDAAVLFNAPPNSRTVVTTDMAVEGRHFRLEWSTPEEIGGKAIIQNFADVEAMGARPVAAVLAVAAPTNTPVSFLRALAHGIGERVVEFSADLVGGDIVAGEQLTVSVTAIGSLGGSLPALTLDAARSGQQLVAAGRIGHSAAGLALLERYGREVPKGLEVLRDAHTSPRIDPTRGMIARSTGATAATDNSDGLIVDLTTLAAASGVAIDLDSDAIAPDADMIRAGELTGTDPWEWVLTGGEDHTILATTAGPAPSGFRVVGRVTKGSGVTVGGERPAHSGGWVSF
ncbi:thiamine-phosphate kinase [Corynebacterium frankenforstense]|uniref:thiamine-phosphate kinase n=1 Tax=Corynebacterium frankenforstense TaxID=1230998 RepID=UPI0026EAA754|nr:thiamine-phosphate kinase [Corynebacterium frankenforstense]